MASSAFLNSVSLQLPRINGTIYFVDPDTMSNTATQNSKPRAGFSLSSLGKAFSNKTPKTQCQTWATIKNVGDLRFNGHECEIRDLRGHEADTNIETIGFEFVHLPSAILQNAGKWSSQKEEDALVEAYSREIEEYMRDKFSAEMIRIYDVSFRKAGTRLPQSLNDVTQQPGVSTQNPNAPAYRAHSDHTIPGGLHKIQSCFNSEERDKYLAENSQYRVRIINVWRPLYSAVQNSPMAYLDPHTVSIADLQPVVKANALQFRQVYFLRHSDKHRWYWLSEQKCDEVAIFTTWDSQKKGFGGGDINFCLHAAFRGINEEAEQNNRESVEVRVIVVTKE